jgi:hypothetical protein
LKWTAAIDCAAPAQNSAVKTGNRAKSNQIGLDSKHSGIDLHVHPSLKVVNKDEERGQGG